MKSAALHSPEFRSHFPQLAAGGKIYFDNAATSLKPKCVIDAVTKHLETSVSNIHRGFYDLSEEVSDRFERARAAIAGSLGADPGEVFFTYNATYGLNFVADLLRENRTEAYVSEFEHHSNLLPWDVNFNLKPLVTDKHGRVDPDDKSLKKLSAKSVVSVGHVSNVTGVIQPVAEIAKRCRKAGALLVVDGCQGYPHLPVDVRELDCDFYVYSPHKAFGPSGVGVVYGKAGVLAGVEPKWLGGGTIDKYGFGDGYVLRSAPQRFEAGTPNVEGVIGAAVAAEFLVSLDRAKIAKESHRLFRHFAERISDLGTFDIVGGVAKGPRVSIVTLSAEWMDTAQMAKLLSDRYGIYARAGYHCAHPLYRKLGIRGGLRFSPYAYNTFEECDKVADVLEKFGKGGKK